MYSIKKILDQPVRFSLTIGGVALCVVLMMFLLSVYRGVEEGSVEYVRASEADLWILQRHATNILRSSSMLSSEYGKMIKGISGIESIHPILFILAGVKLSNCSATTYLTGFNHESHVGGPPLIVQGTSVVGNNDIVLDQSFAVKYNIEVGDLITIQNDTLRVVGLCSGTNMFVIQYAFVSLQRAQAISGFPNIVSCYQVKLKAGFDPQRVADRIRSKFDRITVYDRSTFLKNNIQEMESGFLPLLYIVAFIGAIVLMAILSLILSVNVLEQRNDFAIMKALGSPRGFIRHIVVKQAMILAGTGTIVAFVLFFPLVKVIEKFSPEVSAVTSVKQIIMVTVGVVLISLISTVMPNRRLRHIYPLEVFR
jgi:putative ABC transport system permease protein